MLHVILEISEVGLVRLKCYFVGVFVVQELLAEVIGSGHAEQGLDFSVHNAETLVTLDHEQVKSAQVGVFVGQLPAQIQWVGGHCALSHLTEVYDFTHVNEVAISIVAAIHE